MRSLLLGAWAWLAIAAPALAAWSNNLELPPAAPVVDEAHVLSEEEASGLERLVRTIKQRSGVEIVVFVASSLRERPIEDFSLAVAEQWGLGRKKEDKGLLFVLAPKEKKMRFEVGYGLEGELTDAFSRRVLDNQVRPFLRNGDYYDGIRAGIAAVQEKVPLGLQQADLPEAARAPRSGNHILLLVFVLIVVFSLISRLSGPRRTFGGRGGGGWGGPFIGGGGFGGWGGGGGGGGGGWGGGGGGFGGGGASSDW